MNRIVFLNTCRLIEQIANSPQFKSLRWKRKIVQLHTPDLIGEIVEFNPDLIVIDIFHNKEVCLELLSSLREQFKDVFFLAYTTDKFTKFELSEFRHLIDGISYFEDGIDEFVNNINAVKLGTYKLKIYEEKESQNRIKDPNFTKEEVELIKFFIKEIGYKVIADQIDKVVRTVTNKRKDIIKKAGVSTFNQLIVVACKYKYISSADIPLPPQNDDKTF